MKARAAIAILPVKAGAYLKSAQKYDFSGTFFFMRV